MRPILTSLRLHRLVAGLRQVDLAEKSQIPQPRISDIELGATPTAAEKHRLAEVLGFEKDGQDGA